MNMIIRTAPYGLLVPNYPRPIFGRFTYKWTASEAARDMTGWKDKSVQIMSPVKVDASYTGSRSSRLCRLFSNAGPGRARTRLRTESPNRSVDGKCIFAEAESRIGESCGTEGSL
jgi:hypothetical protein